MDFSGITVNERLYVSGLMDDFDIAINKKDVKTVVEILEKIEIGNGNIPPILKQIGLYDENNISEDSVSD